MAASNQPLRREREKGRTKCWWGWAQAIEGFKFRQTLLFVPPPTPPSTVVVTPPPAAQNKLATISAMISAMAGFGAVLVVIETYRLQDEAQNKDKKKIEELVEANKSFKELNTKLEDSNKSLEAEKEALKKSLEATEQRASTAAKRRWFK